MTRFVGIRAALAARRFLISQQLVRQMDVHDYASVPTTPRLAGKSYRVIA